MSISPLNHLSLLDWIGVQFNWKYYTMYCTMWVLWKCLLVDRESTLSMSYTMVSAMHAHDKCWKGVPLILMVYIIFLGDADQKINCIENFVNKHKYIFWYEILLHDHCNNNDNISHHYINSIQVLIWLIFVVHDNYIQICHAFTVIVAILRLDQWWLPFVVVR